MIQGREELRKEGNGGRIGTGEKWRNEGRRGLLRGKEYKEKGEREKRGTEKRKE